MKINDRVICIEDFNHNHYSFIKNKEYNIAYINHQNGRSLIAVAPMKYSRTLNEIAGKSGEHFWFVLKSGSVKEYKNDDQFKFNDYFIDFKKYRKQKLEKLNSL